jgi:1-deoxy-D-xylulose-5-phosphate reductoisomerase
VERKRIVILGSTGSIGRQTLDVVREHPERLEVVGLAAGSRVVELAKQAAEFGAPACVCDTSRYADLCDALQATALAGEAGLCELAALPEADLVVGAISGLAGLAPVLAALEAGNDVALANKEPLVAAGALVTAAAAHSGAALLPVDSEISAVFQALNGESLSCIEKLILTASGGPFSAYPLEELAAVSPQQALDHPTWRMGRKVTIDSATLANKGFEVFELHWMFGVPFSQIEVVVHHQSIIHSAVQFCDGSVIAQLGLPDMRTAIQYALFHPERAVNRLPRLDLAALGQLTFARPDLGRFPCLRLAYEAGRAGGSYPAVLNGADEEAVGLFLDGRIAFLDIPRSIEAAIEAHEPFELDSLSEILAADAWARDYVRTRCEAGH